MRSLADTLHKGAAYLSLPFSYRRNFLALLKAVLVNRPLTSELVRLAPHRRWLELARVCTILDVGAYIGAFAFAMRLMFPEAQIYSFEPLADSYHALVKNLGGYDNFHAFQTALGEADGELTFWRSEFAASSSALPMNEDHKQAFPKSAVNTAETVTVSRMDGLLPQLDLAGTTLLKLDVQGYELEVLRGGLATLERVDIIMTEVSFKPLYVGQPLFAEVYDFLIQHGFAYAGQLDYLLSPEDGCMLQADALFTRRRLPGG